MSDISTLAQALQARSEELFKDIEEAKIWEVRCVITAVHPIGEKKLVNKENYNTPISKLGCEVGKPFKVCYERGGFFIHQVVTDPPEEDDYGFWVKTTTKIWRFDYI